MDLELDLVAQSTTKDPVVGSSLAPKGPAAQAAQGRESLLPERT